MRTSPGGSVTDSSWRSTWSRRPVSARAGTGSTSGGSSAERIWGSESTTARTPERRRKGPDRRRQLSGPGVAEAGDHVVPAFIIGAALRCVRLLFIQGGPGCRDRAALAVNGEAQLCVVGLAVADFGACLGGGGAAGAGLP